MLQAYKVPKARFIESPPTTRHQRLNPVLPISTDLSLPAVTVAISFLPSHRARTLPPRFPLSNKIATDSGRNCARDVPAVPGFISYHQLDLLATFVRRA